MEANPIILSLPGCLWKDRFAEKKYTFRMQKVALY